MLRKYPAIPILVAVIGGIVVADKLHPASWTLFLAATTLALFALLSYSRSYLRPATMAGVAALGCLAGFHFVISYVEKGSDHVSRFVGSRDIVRVYGEVADWPDIRAGHSEYLVDLDSVLVRKMHRVTGCLLLKVNDVSTMLQRGDRIEFISRIYFIEPNAPEYSSYLRRLNLKGVAGTVYFPTLLDVRVDRRFSSGFFSAIDKIRAFILDSFERNLSPPSAALAGGFLLGETRNISPETYALFRESGTLHVLAVSGSNVALVLLFVLLLMKPFGIRQPWRNLILMLVVVLFALLSYGEPSVVRASVMAMFVLLAGILGREYDLNHVVALTVLCILSFEPGQLYDVGFQLSVVTAWGLVFLVKPLSQLFERWHNRLWYRWIVFSVIISLVAQFCSAPLIAYYFGTVPVATVLANLVVVPLASIATVALLLVLVADLIWPIIGLFAGSLIDPILRLIVLCLSWSKSLNFPQLDFGPLMFRPLSIFWILTYFVVLICLVFGVKHRPPRRYALLAILVACGVGLLHELTLAGNPGGEVALSGLPGGIVAVVTPRHAEASDLIFSTSLLSIDDLDSRLLSPVLDMNRVKRLKRLFVLSCPYDNIDDLMRVSSVFHCETVFVAATNRASFEDYAIYHADSAGSTKIVYFGNQTPTPHLSGYYLGADQVKLISESHSITISGRLRDDLAPLGAGSIEQSLVLASRWSPKPQDWIALRERGFDRIVCSRIDQPHNSDEAVMADNEAGLSFPDYVVDLRRTGPYDLPL